MATVGRRHTMAFSGTGGSRVALATIVVLLLLLVVWPSRRNKAPPSAPPRGSFLPPRVTEEEGFVVTPFTIARFRLRCPTAAFSAISPSTFEATTGAASGRFHLFAAALSPPNADSGGSPLNSTECEVVLSNGMSSRVTGRVPPAIFMLTAAKGFRNAQLFWSSPEAWETRYDFLHTGLLIPKNRTLDASVAVTLFTTAPIADRTLLFDDEVFFDFLRINPSSASVSQEEPEAAAAAELLKADDARLRGTLNTTNECHSPIAVAWDTAEAARRNVSTRVSQLTLQFDPHLFESGVFGDPCSPRVMLAGIAYARQQGRFVRGARYAYFARSRLPDFEYSAGSDGGGNSSGGPPPSSSSSGGAEDSYDYGEDASSIGRQPTRAARVVAGRRRMARGLSGPSATLSESLEAPTSSGASSAGGSSPLPVPSGSGGSSTAAHHNSSSSSIMDSSHDNSAQGSPPPAICPVQVASDANGSSQSNRGGTAGGLDGGNETALPGGSNCTVHSNASAANTSSSGSAGAATDSASTYSDDSYFWGSNGVGSDGGSDGGELPDDPYLPPTSVTDDYDAPPELLIPSILIDLIQQIYTGRLKGVNVSAFLLASLAEGGGGETSPTNANASSNATQAAAAFARIMAEMSVLDPRGVVWIRPDERSSFVDITVHGTVVNSSSSLPLPNDGGQSTPRAVACMISDMNSWDIVPNAKGDAVNRVTYAQETSLLTAFDDCLQQQDCMGVTTVSYNNTDPIQLGAAPSYSEQAVYLSLHTAKYELLRGAQSAVLQQRRGQPYYTFYRRPISTSSDGTSSSRNRCRFLVNASMNASIYVEETSLGNVGLQVLLNGTYVKTCGGAEPVVGDGHAARGMPGRTGYCQSLTLCTVLPSLPRGTVVDLVPVEPMTQSGCEYSLYAVFNATALLPESSSTVTAPAEVSWAMALPPLLPPVTADAETATRRFVSRRVFLSKGSGSSTSAVARLFVQNVTDMKLAVAQTGFGCGVVGAVCGPDPIVTVEVESLGLVAQCGGGFGFREGPGHSDACDAYMTCAPSSNATYPLQPEFTSIIAAASTTAASSSAFTGFVTIRVAIGDMKSNVDVCADFSAYLVVASVAPRADLFSATSTTTADGTAVVSPAPVESRDDMSRAVFPFAVNQQTGAANVFVAIPMTMTTTTSGLPRSLLETPVLGPGLATPMFGRLRLYRTNWTSLLLDAASGTADLLALSRYIPV